MSENLEELELQFNIGQQRAVDKFKQKLRNVMEDVMSDFYTDVLNYATTDSHLNYHNYLRDHFRESFIKEITEEWGHYSWAHGIRMKLLELYPEKINSKIIDDLKGRITSLEEQNDQLRRNRY